MGLILTLNAGSATIKFALYEHGGAVPKVAAGMIDRLGSQAAELVLRKDGENHRRQIGAADHAAGIEAILQAVAPILGGASLSGIGHRIVHGGRDYDRPIRLDADILATLHRLEPFAPLHQPHNLAAVATARAAFPDAVQVGCFDTAFHRGHPWVSDTYALPKRFFEAGIRRYGFHGLSFDHVSGELARLDKAAGQGRTVIAHLGNGASICALKAGRSMAATMGFSPLDGLPMGTRCGQIDPGVLLYLMQQEGLEPDRISDLLYRESGLKGLSGISHDMRELEAAGTDEARQAIAYFVHHIRREVGAMAAVLGGLDTLVFCGGIGENSAMIRAKVCDGMGWLGISLDDTANAPSNSLLSTGPVAVRVIPTDEEAVIARAVDALLV